jgi:hypothetical protein
MELTLRAGCVLNVVFECNYLSNYRLEFKNMMLRKIFGDKLLTGRWKIFQ